MPVCTWCGIESKSDLVCDWCKRPLALSAMRRPASGRSAVDLLKEGDDEKGGLSKRGVQALIVAAVCIVIMAAWLLGSRSSEPSATAAPQEFSATRETAAKTPAPSTAPAPKPAFIPEPPNRRNESIAFKAEESSGGGGRASLPSAPLAVQIVREEDDLAPTSGPAVRLTGGLIRSTGGRKGISVGRISITNSTDSSVQDFRLEAVINGRTYPLQPFEGTLDRPKSFSSKLIRSGERLTVPVIVNGYNGGRKQVIVPARIVLSGWLASGPGIVKDELLTP